MKDIYDEWASPTPAHQTFSRRTRATAQRWGSAWGRAAIMAIAHGTIAFAILYQAPLTLSEILVDTLLITLSAFATALVGDRLFIRNLRRRSARSAEPNLVPIPVTTRAPKVDRQARFQFSPLLVSLDRRLSQPPTRQSYYR